MRGKPVQRRVSFALSPSERWRRQDELLQDPIADMLDRIQTVRPLMPVIMAPSWLCSGNRQREEERFLLRFPAKVDTASERNYRKRLPVEHGWESTMCRRQPVHLQRGDRCWRYGGLGIAAATWQQIDREKAALV